MKRNLQYSVAKSLIALLFAGFLMSYCNVQANSNASGCKYPPPDVVHIPNVPDWSWPSASGGTNYCAPLAAMNILGYYAIHPTDPVIGLIDPNDWSPIPPNPFTADYIGYFMGTNGAGSPARVNNSNPPDSPRPGTVVLDEGTGLSEYIAWKKAGQFDPSDPAPPDWKVGHSNANVTIDQRPHNILWDEYVAEIDSMRPVKIDFVYWNLKYTGSSFVEDITGETIHLYDWDDYSNFSGPPDPVEEWDSDIGHAVTGVGYIINYDGCPNMAIVHDTWATTHMNIAIPWDHLMALVTVKFQDPLPVAYWRFNEGAGNVAHDETSNDNDGLLTGSSTGPEWINRSSASALYFHGGFATDAVEVPHSSSLDITGEFTVEAWIDSVGSNAYYAIVDKYRDFGGYAHGFTLYMTDGKPRVTTYSGTNGSKTLFGTSNLRGNASHHVAATWNGEYLRIYVDTVLENEAAWAYPPVSTTEDLGIGLRLSGYGGYMPFEGIIDEVKIYKRAITQNEICYDFEDGFIRGDVNGDGAVNVADAVYLITWIFKGGPAPDPLASGDVNCDGQINLGDAVYLVVHIFKNGPPPMESCCSGKGKNLASFKATPAVLTSYFDEENTILEIASETDLYGVQLEIDCEDNATIVNLVENTELYSKQSGNHAKIGIVDMNGIGHINAGREVILEISGYAIPISAIGADRHGNTAEMIIESVDKIPTIPGVFSLEQNYPNPFNPATEISFAIPMASEVKLEVFNITGRIVTTLVDGNLDAGEHSVVWDGRDAGGRLTASGVYLYRIQAGEFSDTKKMVLMK